MHVVYSGYLDNPALPSLIKTPLALFGMSGPGPRDPVRIVPNGCRPHCSALDALSSCSYHSYAIVAHVMPSDACLMCHGQFMKIPIMVVEFVAS